MNGTATLKNLAALKAKIKFKYIRPPQIEAGPRRKMAVRTLPRDPPVERWPENKIKHRLKHN